MSLIFLWSTYKTTLTKAKDSTELLHKLIKNDILCKIHIFYQGKYSLGYE